MYNQHLLYTYVGFVSVFSVFNDRKNVTSTVSLSDWEGRRKNAVACARIKLGDLVSVRTTTECRVHGRVNIWNETPNRWLEGE